VVTDDQVSFDLGNRLGTPLGAAQFKGQAATADRMTGEMRQAGNIAKFALARRGPAQVDAPPQGTPVGRELEAQWEGEFELGGYPRKVTIALENHAGAAATAKLVIVGKRVNDIPVDLVVQQGTLVRVESQSTQIVYEGRLREGADEIRGAIELGSIELPLHAAPREGSVMKPAAPHHPARSREPYENRGCQHGAPRPRRVCRAGAQSMFRGDASHTGVFRSEGPREFHRVKWTFPTGDRIVSSPVFADGVIYFGGDDGQVYAVDAADGRQRWKYKTGGPVPSSPAVAGGVVYAASYDGKLHAIDAKTGQSRWKFETGGERRFEAKNLHGMLPKNQTIADAFDVFLSSPVVAAGAGLLRQRRWPRVCGRCGHWQPRLEIQDRRCVHSSPAFADGVVYFGSWDSWFYAVDAKTGALQWRFHGGEDPLIHNQVGFQSSPAVVNGVVYTGCRDSKLYAIDAATGRAKWHFDAAGSWVISSPAVAEGKVVFGTSDSSLYLVLDAETGKELVRQQGQAFVFSSPRSRATRFTSACSTARWRRAISRVATCCGSSKPRRRSAMPAGC
jgi:hypothetical protein